MTTPPALARLLAVAKHEAALGLRENPMGSNRVKYNDAFYGRPVHGKAYPWCAVFQWWCFQRAGIPTSYFPKCASVFGIRDWFVARGRARYRDSGRLYSGTPRVGSLVILTVSHIGLVVAHDAHRITTIEGNTDRAGGRTGGRVMVKVRSRRSGIAGYCHPEYDKVPVPVPVAHPPAPRPSAPRPSVPHPPVPHTAGPAPRPAPRPASSIPQLPISAEAAALAQAIGRSVARELLTARAGSGTDAVTVAQSLYRMQSNLNRDDRQTKRLAQLQVLLHEGRADLAQQVLAAILADHPLPEPALVTAQAPPG